MSKNFKEEFGSYMSNIKPSEKLINDTISLLEEEQCKLNNQKIRHNPNRVLYLLNSSNFKRYSALTFTIMLSIFAVKLWNNSSINDIPVSPIENNTIITNPEITSYESNFSYTTTNSTSYLSSYDDFITNDTSTYTYTDTLTSLSTKTISTSNATIVSDNSKNTTITTMETSNNTKICISTDNYYNISNNDVTISSNEIVSNNNEDNNYKPNTSTNSNLTNNNRPSVTDIIPIITTKPLVEKVTTISTNTITSDIAETPHTTNNTILSTTSKDIPTNDITTSFSISESIITSQNNNNNITSFTTTEIVTTECIPVTATNVDTTHISDNTNNSSNNSNETIYPTIKDYSIRNISGTDYNDTHPFVAIRFFFKNDINGYYYDDTLNINKILENFPHSDCIPNNDCIITLSKNSSYCDAVVIYKCTFSEINEFISDFYKTITNEENEFAMPIVGESFIDYDNIITDNLDTSLVLAKLKLDTISLIDPRITVALNRISYLN